MDSGKKVDIGGACFFFLTIFKTFCTSLNSRKLLWLPQEMGRGNPRASSCPGGARDGRLWDGGTMDTLLPSLHLILGRLSWEEGFSVQSWFSSGHLLRWRSSSPLWLLCSVAPWPPQTLWILLGKTSAAASGTFNLSVIDWHGFSFRVKSRIFNISESAAAEAGYKDTVINNFTIGFLLKYNYLWSLCSLDLILCFQQCVFVTCLISDDICCEQRSLNAGLLQWMASRRKRVFYPWV